MKDDREQQEWFSRIAEQSREMIWEVDADGLYTYVSPNCKRITGYSPEELTGKMHFYDLCPEKGRDAFRRAAFEVFEHKELFRELRNAIATKDGREVWVSTNGTPVLDDIGRILGYRGSDCDITDFIRAEEALRESGEKYLGIFQNAVMGIFRTTPDGCYLSANPAGARIYGYKSPEEMIQSVADMAHQIYVHSEDRKRLKELVERIGFVEGFESEHYTKDGNKIWVSMNARVIRDSSGTILYYETTSQDITERKNADEELRSAHKQLLDIIDFLPDATLVIDRDRRVVAWNRAIEEMTGIPKEEMIGKGNYAYAVPFYGERRPILIDLLFETDVDIEKKYDFVHKIGNTYFVEIFIPGMYAGRGAYLWASASKLLDSQGKITGALESIRDVTERKDAEARILESEEKYRGIFEHAVEGIFQTTPAGQFISVNPALAGMMGFDSPDQMVKTFTDIARHHYVNPSERMRYRRLLEENGFVRAFEAEVYRKGGDKIWISISARAVSDKSGILDHYEGTIVDITSRKEAAVAVQKAYQTTRSIVENAPFGVYVVNEEGYIEYANVPMSKILGINIEQLKKHNVLNLPTYLNLGIAEKIKSTIDGTPFSTEPFEHTSHLSNKKMVRKYTGIPIEEAGERKALIFVEDLTELKRAEEQLKKERETFYSIIENSPDGVMLVGSQGRFDYVNPEFTHITGYTKEDVPDGKQWFQKAYPDSAYRKFVIDEWKKDALSGRRGKSLESKVVCQDGQVKGIEFRTTHLEDGSAVTVITDVTELRKIERELKESEEQFRSLFESSRDAIYIVTGKGSFIDMNQAFVELFGYTKDETLKLNVKTAYLTNEDREIFKQVIKENDFIRDFEIRLKKRDGTVMDCLLTVTCKRDEKGKITQYQGIVRDITERKRTEEAIRHMAFHDALTGLPNRSLFNDRLVMAMVHAERFNEKVAVMMLDLDKFKDVNDTFGHSIGDLLLKAVAEKLTLQIRKGDTVARMGGDEFMLIFADLKQTEDVNTITEKILEDFQTNITINNHTMSVTMSIGIAIYPDHGGDIDTLVKNADIAMYSVKQTGRNGYRYYSA
jgi:diguanylate cyclase (GGDEF)-like protein/PAS domain S-box-containing protein